MSDFWNNSLEFLEQYILLMQLSVDNTKKLKNVIIENQVTTIDTYNKLLNSDIKRFLELEVYEGYKELLALDKELEESENNLKDLVQIKKEMEGYV